MKSSRVGTILWIVIGASLLIHVVCLLAGKTLLRGWTWPQEPVHAAIEMGGSLVALLVAAILVALERHGRGSSFNVWIAGALIGMGVLDGFHALVSEGPTFVWLHSTATFVGGALFMLVWLPKAWALHVTKSWPWTVAAATAVFGAASLMWPELIPDMMDTDQDPAPFTFLSKALNVAGGLLMFGAAVQLARTHFKTSNVDDLLFCLLCLLFGAAAVMFEQSVLWDVPWWGWHLLRVMAYGVALWFVVRTWEQTHREFTQALQRSNTELEQRVTEREATEKALKQTNEDLARVNADLERFNRLAIGREETVLELKGAVNSLLARLGKPPQFATTIGGEEAIPVAPETDDSASIATSATRPLPETSRCVEVDWEAAEKAGLEKTQLEISFIPITCSAPLIYAHSRGFFAREGLDVKLQPAPGWSGVKHLMAYGKVDAAHMLAPMPLACSLGINGRKSNIRLAAIQNVNGQALTLAKKHLGIKDVRDMKGFTFGVPYRFSMHYYLLCHLLAANGINPQKDVTIKEVSPPRMPYHLERGWVDGVFAPEPFNQIPVHRGIGFIYVLSKDLWAGHPCCCFATSQDFIDRYPNTYRTMLGCVLRAELELHRAGPDERKAIARDICDPGHLNQRDTIPVEQAMSGEFPDGTGRDHVVPDRMDFMPYPWPEYGQWMLSQMQRWAQLPGRVDYHEVVESIFQVETRDLAEALGFEPQDKPRLEAIHPFGDQDPFTYMRNQPFCAFQEQAKPAKDYNVSEPVRTRLDDICSHLGNVAGGKTNAPLEITTDGEIGHLEQIVNETLLNLRFSQEAVLEQMDLLEARAEELQKSRKVLLGLAEDTDQARKKAEREVAERKRAEQELANSADELARSNADLEQFAYVASHDLQEPLRAVNGYCQLLQMEYEGQLDEEANKYIRHAVEGATRMQTLINDLLEYSRVNRKGNPFERTDVGQVLEMARALLQASIDESNAEIGSEELPTLAADHRQLLQLFQNLIGNALKYRGDVRPAIQISAEEGEDEWLFSVRDNGIGIAPEFRERIFVLFQRLHTRGEYSGTGIGLALCKRIVERHGGRIWVESEPGEGSTFFFTISKQIGDRNGQ